MGLGTLWHWYRMGLRTLLLWDWCRMGLRTLLLWDWGRDGTGDAMGLVQNGAGNVMGLVQVIRTELGPLCRSPVVPQSHRNRTQWGCDIQRDRDTEGHFTSSVSLGNNRSSARQCFVSAYRISYSLLLELPTLCILIWDNVSNTNASCSLRDKILRSTTRPISTTSLARKGLNLV